MPPFDSVGILMIATNDYLERWKDTALDLEKNAFRGESIVSIHLFTNRIIDAADFAKQHLSRIQLVVHEINGWGWPEATLFRYRFFHEVRDSVTESFLVYLDSDMRVVGDIAKPIFEHGKDDGIGVVIHPGFYRPKGLKLLTFYKVSPTRVLRDAKIACQSSRHLGAWERNVNSTAYVPRRMRRSYAHGAIWFGYRNVFFSMCQELDHRTSLDLNRGIIALWHDESHLNWYISNNAHRIYDNNLSWVENYSNLLGYNNTYLVSNVQKTLGEGRTPSNV